MTKTKEDNEMMPRWRYDALRSSNVEALRIASMLLAHYEGTYTIDEQEVYHELVNLSTALAQGLHKGTQM